MEALIAPMSKREGRRSSKDGILWPPGHGALPLTRVDEDDILSSITRRIILKNKES